ncbi:pPE family protein [Mycobacterium kansasii]|uniref:PPE family protein n=1 Tax=Mycobacterium kansasii TaxID=1768 RepID=A0A1V3X5J4_MYCKA|nr:pPE family protein [Mycobacterium kansasii]
MGRVPGYPAHRQRIADRRPRRTAAGRRCFARWLLRHAPDGPGGQRGQRTARRPDASSGRLTSPGDPGPWRVGPARGPAARWVTPGAKADEDAAVSDRDELNQLRKALADVSRQRDVLKRTAATLIKEARDK